MALNCDMAALSIKHRLNRNFAHPHNFAAVLHTSLCDHTGQKPRAHSLARGTGPSRARADASGLTEAARGRVSRLQPRSGREPADSAGDSRQDLARDQLNLAPLITQRPELDPLAARAGIARQQLRALERRADADPAAKLRGIPPDQRSNDPG